MQVIKSLRCRVLANRSRRAGQYDYDQPRLEHRRRHPVDTPPAYRDARTRATHAAAAGRPATPLEQAQYHNGELEGSFAGNLGVDDADRRRRYTLRLVLLRRSNNEFNGGVWTRPIPGLDNGPLHTYWVQLTR